MLPTQILVVEDENIVATSIRMELASMGYDVPAIASSGEEAVRLAGEIQPDLVLMDIVLKGDMDGVEASEEIRDRFDIPVVFLTAYADDPTLRRAKITEPYGYLLKPYEERELRTTIETALFKHRTQRLSEAMRRWLSAVFRSMGDGLIVTNANGGVTLMNRAAETLTGWSSDDAFGKRWNAVVHLVDARSRQVLDNPAATAFQQAGPVRLPANALVVARDGTETLIDGTLAPVQDDEENFAGFVLVFHDMRSGQDHSSPARRPVSRADTPQPELA
jgi:PAS domain S-box-containing protein